MHPRILVSATSDLVTDQRVDRSACTIKDMGFEVLVIGRKKRTSPNMPSRRYRSYRFKLFFERGPFFYASFNLRLFWFLMRNKAVALYSNDLDTLPANYLVSKIKKIPLIFDSHEYFTGVPELEGRPFVQKFWKWIERKIVPKLTYTITVNQSIARLFQEEYGNTFLVLRNLPLPLAEEMLPKEVLRHELNLPTDKHLVILQGAGINIHRGAEEAVQAMEFLQQTILLIVGTGDVIPQLKAYVNANNLGDRVWFIPRQTARNLRKYTQAADLGLSLDKDTNLNYRYSLPNKLFDYIQAQIPVLASDLPEIKKIVEGYQVGMICKTHEPKALAQLMRQMLTDTEQRKFWAEKLKSASDELNWGNEKRGLEDILRKIG